MNQIVKISDKDVSVVVQGALSGNFTVRCLQSIKQYLPNAEVILSTWEGTDLTLYKGLYDSAILLKDPGAYFFGQDNKKNNINRIILSSKEGLKLVKRPYCLKMRSDLILKNDNILNIKRFKRVNDFKLFKERLLVSQLFTLKYEEGNAGQRHWRLFHVSDWWHFGLTTDIQKLFNISLVREPDFSYYMAFNPADKDVFMQYPWRLWRFSPEQYILYSCASKLYPEIKYRDNSDYNGVNIVQSEKVIVNNFHVLTQKDSGIYPIKPDYKRFDIKLNPILSNGIYSPYVWFFDYKKYIDQDFKIPDEVLKEEIDRRIKISHLRHMHLENARVSLRDAYKNILRFHREIRHYLQDSIYYIINGKSILKKEKNLLDRENND